MIKEFGEDYKQYMAKTKMFIPFVVESRKLLLGR